jgi:catechol 2,3-dioxygenase-like lactoylglutathione lyase family enzyme
MHMHSAIPTFQVRNMERSLPFYRDILGMSLIHHDGGFAIFGRNEIEIHLGQADDESWRNRDIREKPVRSGSESFLAGTASCRIGMSGVEEYYPLLVAHDVIHPNGKIRTTEWGTREFAVLDPDNNLITFFERVGRDTQP